MDNPDQKIRLSKEHDDYKWIGEVGEAGMLVMPDQRKTIEKALNMGRSITMDPDNSFSTNDTVEEYLDHLNNEWVTVYSSATTDYQISNRTAIALGVLLAWAVAGAFSAYRSKASGAVDACKSSKGEAKTKCIEKFKNAGRKKQIEMLEKAKGYCVKTPNPQKCRAKLDEKISKVKTKMK
jgi:biotin carboxylase